jgi:hypothetical protein
MMVFGKVRTLHATGELDAGGERRHAHAGKLWWRAFGVAALLILSTVAATARDPDPAVRIPLDALGYQPPTQEFLLSGSSMLTVDFVDKDHLLITFGLRRLMKREADSRPNDDDRMVGAYLVELPSGKLLAHTEWRVHDRGRYLWDIGHGWFLLRVRDRLTMFSPLEGEEPFAERPVLSNDRHIVAVQVSSDSDLLTLETTNRAAGPGEASDAYGGVLTPEDNAPVQLNFYRMVESGDKLVFLSAGAIRSRIALALPVTTAGFLEELEGGKNTWMFNFDEHAGKVSELAAWDTSCFPRATFVGHSEFVAFGCRGSNDKQEIAGFNLKGEQMWQQGFFDNYIAPTFAFAPAAGRFALGRTIINGPFDPDIPVPASAVSTQEVRVYQTYNGKQLFRIECSPVQRAGQNFSLSPDGMQLAVIRDTTAHRVAKGDLEEYTEHRAAVEVYALPLLTDKDQAALKDVERLAPADTGARIDNSLARKASKRDKVDTASTADHGPAGGGLAPVSSQVSPPAADAPQQTPSAGASEEKAATAGDVESSEPRKPPTLYGPDEKKPAQRTPN